MSFYLKIKNTDNYVVLIYIFFLLLLLDLLPEFDNLLH